MATQKRVPRVFVKKFPWKLERGYSPGLEIDYDSNEVDLTWSTIPGGSWFEKSGNAYVFRARANGNFNTDLVFKPKAGFEDKYEPVTLTFKTEVYNSNAMGQLNWNMFTGWKADLTPDNPSFELTGGNSGLIRMEVVQAIENGVASGRKVTARGNGAFVVYGFGENPGSMSVSHGWTVNTSGFGDDPTYPKSARPTAILPYTNIKLPINSSHKVDLQFFPPNANYDVLIPRTDVTTFDKTTKTLTLSGVVTEGTNKPTAAIGIKPNINGYLGDESIFNVTTTKGPAMSVYPMFVGDEVNSSQVLDIKLFNGATLEYTNNNPDLFDFNPDTKTLRLKKLGDGTLDLYPVNAGVKGDKQVVRVSIHPKPVISIVNKGPFEVTRGDRIPLEITVTPEDSYVVAQSNNPGLWFDSATNEIVTGGNTGDYTGTLTFSANREGINSSPVSINVKVNYPPKPWIEVVPSGPIECVPGAAKKTLRVKCMPGSSWDYTSSNRNLVTMDYNTGALTVGNNPGQSATLTFKAYRQGMTSDPLNYVVNIVGQESPITKPTITVDPAGPINIKKNTRQIITVQLSPEATWSTSSTDENVAKVDENSNEIVAGDAPGKSATITFISRRKDLESDPVEVVVNVLDDSGSTTPPVVDPNPPVTGSNGYDNWDKVKELLDNASKTVPQKVDELRRSLSQAGSIVQTFYGYKLRVSPGAIAPTNEAGVGLIYNLLMHIKYVIELTDEKEFTVTMDLINALLKEYGDNGLSDRELMRYTTPHFEEIWKEYSKLDYLKYILSWKNAVKVFTSLKDPTIRPQELSKINLDQLLDPKTTIFTAKALENLKKYYGVNP